MATQLKAVAPPMTIHLGNVLTALDQLRAELLSIVAQDASSVDMELDQFDGRPALFATFHLFNHADTVRAKFSLEMSNRRDMTFHNVQLRRVGSSATKFIVTAFAVPA